MTPFVASQHIRAYGEAHISQAWWSERFAREDRLSSLNHYLEPKKPGDADDADAFLTTFAMMHGQDVLDLDASTPS